MDSLLSHIGIAVKDLEKSVEVFKLLTGCEPSAVHHVVDQKVKAQFFEAASDNDNTSNDNTSTKIELVSPASPDSPIARFIERRGEGMHHIAIWVDNIETILAELKKAGVKLIDEVPRVGAEGCRIAFVHPKSTSGVLIELQERPQP